MKTIKYILLYILLVALVVACTKDDETVVYNPENAVPSVLSAIDPEYVLEEEKENEVLAAFKWTASDFGFRAAIEYILEVDLEGKNFENPVEVFAVKKALSYEVTYGAINTAMMNLQRLYELEEGAAQSVAFRLKSSISSSATPVYSNVILSSVTPYDGGPVTMYMIGDEFGDWDWDDDIVEMIPVHGAEGDFWCIRYFNAGKGFKWSPEKGWGKDFEATGTYEGFRTDGGNAYVDAAGMYMVYISTKRDHMVIEPAKIYGIGDAFGSWDTGLALFTINRDKAEIVTTGSGELRMYTDCSIATTDWWTREFIILNGVITYRGDGDDQERVSVNAGRTITLDFNTGTGTIQ